MDISLSGRQISAFKTFPEFSKLTIEDKHAYEVIINDFPPVAEISFASLLTWWNFLDSCSVSQLNGNLIISYWLPGDEKNSGLSLVGTQNVDDSICTVFDYLREQKEPVRFVHVPEFVVGCMKYPELFTYISEPDYDEGVYAISNFYPLKRATKHVHSKIEKFLSKVEEKQVSVRSLDFRLKANRDLLLECSNRWYKKGTINDIAKIDREAFKTVMTHAEALDIENVCLYIDDELAGFQLYQTPADKRYIIATFIKVDYSIPGLFEYMLHICAKRFGEQGATYINFEQDLGIPRLRAEKLALGPINYFRKYTIEPAS